MAEMMVIMESDNDGVLSARYCTLTKILDDLYTSSYEAHKSGQLMGINRITNEARCNEVTSPMSENESQVVNDARNNKAHIHDDDDDNMEEDAKCKEPPSSTSNMAAFKTTVQMCNGEAVNCYHKHLQPRRRYPMDLSDFGLTDLLTKRIYGNSTSQY